jgi:hypothetical protein
MALAHSPKIVTDGLVLCLDAANQKSFDPRENLYPHGETLQSLSNTRVTRQSFATGGPFNRGYQEFTATESSTTGIYNFDSGNTISLIAGQIITFSVYFRNISLSGGIFLRCWTGSGRAWTTQRQVQYDLVNETSAPSTGTIIRHSISNEGGGWYRLSMTVQADVHGFSAISINVGGNIGEQYQATAVQVSNGIALTKYLQTTGTVIQRSTSINSIVNSNSADLVNGVGFSSDNNGSIVFDGVDDYVDLGDNSTINNSLNGNTNWTISYWCNPLNNGRILDRGNLGSDPTGSLELNVTSISRNNTSGGSSSLSVNIINTGWNFVSLTRNSSLLLSWYLNGVFSNSSQLTKSYDGGGIWKIGRRAFNLSSIYSGNISSLQIYNRVLLDQEVAQNFAALRGRYGI